MRSLSIIPLLRKRIAMSLLATVILLGGGPFFFSGFAELRASSEEIVVAQAGPSTDSFSDRDTVNHSAAEEGHVHGEDEADHGEEGHVHSEDEATHGEEGHVHIEDEATHGEEGHVHSEDEAHTHSETEGESGVVEVPQDLREPLGIIVEPVQKGNLALTLDLYGWVRPRPSDVTELRAPVPALVSEIHVHQGQMVEVGQPLVTLVVPSALDWQKTILAAYNEKSQLAASHDLLLAEGESKVVQLLGEIRVAAAERERLSDELSLLEQAGSEAIARRDVNVKRGELKSAVALLEAKRALSLAYGLDPEFTTRIEAGEIGIQVPQGALPPEIRRQLRENEYKGVVASNDAQAAAQNLTSLGFNHGIVTELSQGNLSKLTDRLVLSADRPGLVSEVRVTRQSSLNAAETILRIIDYRMVYVDAEVSEPDISRVLARGSDQMPIHFTGLADQVVEGRVAFFDTTIHPDVRKAHLVLEVRNLEGLPLREHMAASVSVPMEVREDILSVPKSSLVTDSFQKVVFVEEGGHFHRTPVKTGIENLTSVEILEGLSVGDQVVVSGARVLLLALSAPQGGDAHAGHSH